MQPAWLQYLKMIQKLHINVGADLLMRQSFDKFFEPTRTLSETSFICAISMKQNRFSISWMLLCNGCSYAVIAGFALLCKYWGMCCFSIRLRRPIRKVQATNIVQMSWTTMTLVVLTGRHHLLICLWVTNNCKWRVKRKRSWVGFGDESRWTLLPATRAEVFHFWSY